MVVDFDGVKYKKKKFKLSHASKMFRANGYTLEERDSFTKRVGNYLQQITILKFKKQ